MSSLPTVEAITYIYSLNDPQTGLIRYIGKTWDLRIRFRSHLEEARNGARSHRCNWIRSLLAEEMEPIQKIIEGCRGEGNEEEIYHIALARADGLKLVNGTDGGEGMRGWRPSEECRRRMSEARKGKAPPAAVVEAAKRARTGMKLPDEWRRKMAESRKNNPVVEAGYVKTGRKLRILSDAQESAFVQDYLRGERPEVLRARYGIGDRTIRYYRILYRHGVKGNRRGVKEGQPLPEVWAENIRKGHRCRIESAKAKDFNPSTSPVWMRSRRMVATLRQADVAKLAGITQAYLSSIEMGKVHPSQKVWDSIQLALNG